MLDKNDFLALTGRVFLAVIFLASAFGQITNFRATTNYKSAHGLPASGLLCVLAVVVEVLGGLALVLGFNARGGAAVLTVFMVPVTLIFHHAPDQRIQFLKNMAIMGGLLNVIAFGPGEISLDTRGAAKS